MNLLFHTLAFGSGLLITAPAIYLLQTQAWMVGMILLVYSAGVGPAHVFYKIWSYHSSIIRGPRGETSVRPE